MAQVLWDVWRRDPRIARNNFGILQLGLLSMGYHAPMTDGIALLKVEGPKGVKRSS